MPAGNNHTSSPRQPKGLSTEAIPLLRSRPTAAAVYAGKWDGADCQDHHQDGRARYFHFTLSGQKSVAISLMAGTLYVSKGTPDSGWGADPGGTYEQRRETRRGNGKLLHDGLHATTAQDDGLTVTLTLEAGETYTVEAAGTDGGKFTVSITPQ